MGKGARIRREKRHKELAKLQIRIPKGEEPPEIYCLLLEDIKTHVSRIDSNIEGTILEALEIRQLYNRPKANELSLYMRCVELMRNKHYPRIQCPDCGINCIFQKEPPLPTPAVRIEDWDTQIAIRIVNPKSLSIHNKLTKESLRSQLFGEDQLKHSEAECERMNYKALSDLKDLLSQVTKEVVRECGTPNLSKSAQRRLRFHISNELNRNYDLSIDPWSTDESLGLEDLAPIFLRFNKDGKPIHDENGELLYGPMLGSIPEICAMCLDLPCCCPSCPSIH